MSAVVAKSLDELIDGGAIELTRGKIISKKDMLACPGPFPVYSSAKENDGKFGEYGRFMFDEELITWSVDGGGRPFYRPRHKFSVTNVGGVLRIKDKNLLGYRYLHYVLALRHSQTKFDWVRKAHPSVIRKLYRDIPMPPLVEQQRIIVSDDWDLRALQAVLLSGIASLFVSIYSTKMRGGYLRFQAQYLRRIRIPRWLDVPNELKTELVAAAERCDKTSCDSAAFRLYGLSAKEQQALSGSGD